MVEHKKSIRFFNDCEVRAVWDEEQNCWWFSATDIVRAINNEPDYTKAGNYWRWLKRKLKQKNVELVSATHGFKVSLQAIPQALPSEPLHPPPHQSPPVKGEANPPLMTIISSSCNSLERKSSVNFILKIILLKQLRRSSVGLFPPCDDLNFVISKIQSLQK